MPEKLQVKILAGATGLAQNVDADAGSTFGAVLVNNGIDPQSLTVRVLRGGAYFTPAASDAVRTGDFISCVPAKIEGAARR